MVKNAQPDLFDQVLQPCHQVNNPVGDALAGRRHQAAEKSSLVEEPGRLQRVPPLLALLPAPPSTGLGLVRPPLGQPAARRGHLCGAAMSFPAQLESRHLRDTVVISNELLHCLSQSLSLDSLRPNEIDCI